jgi:hypothetical protein
VRSDGAADPSRQALRKQCVSLRREARAARDGRAAERQELLEALEARRGARSRHIGWNLSHIAAADGPRIIKHFAARVNCRGKGELSRQAEEAGRVDTAAALAEARAELAAAGLREQAGRRLNTPYTPP